MISANDQRAKDEALTKKQKKEKKKTREKVKRRLAVKPPPPTCSMPLTKCPTHGYIHGAEAEELRSGIETLIVKDFFAEEFVGKLHALLDAVDARDSCAFSEAFGFARTRKK